MSMPASGGQKTLNLILKADGQGAVEALRARMQGLSNGEVDIRVIYAGVGAITPNDVNLASASNAVLIGFNIRPDETVKRLAENEMVDLRFYQVIYDVENDLRKAMVGMLAPKFREIILGRAQVREVFKVSKIGTIAGCYVQSGKLIRNSKVRILRDGASSTTANSHRCAASRKTFKKSPTASNAAYRSPNSATSKSATRSKPTPPSW